MSGIISWFSAKSKKRHERMLERIVVAIDQEELTVVQILEKVNKGVRVLNRMSSATIYPILMELERQEIITSRWTWPTPLKYPRRRLYKVVTKLNHEPLS
jgi:DNA-binding PadR family transcriptional regulator